ncbi:hypothetical protein GGR04_004746 [Aureimonas pseudogalii]|uniref:Uncharacterized protein n=1 Tax=Aureimonas pseudogalii TaxID=1744844 RepID=A0A7W6H922_9HYPH|nr:hypothetical protein [Aureimonas pseudogalii]
MFNSILHGDPDLAFDTADGLLQRLGKQRVRLLDTHRELELAIGIEHQFSPVTLCAMAEEATPL